MLPASTQSAARWPKVRSYFGLGLYPSIISFLSSWYRPKLNFSEIISFDFREIMDCVLIMFCDNICLKEHLIGHQMKFLSRLFSKFKAIRIQERLTSPALKFCGYYGQFGLGSELRLTLFVSFTRVALALSFSNTVYWGSRSHINFPILLKLAARLHIIIAISIAMLYKCNK